MPFLIRIILQRVLILLYSFLAFLGIAPETSIPTEQEAQIAIEERREAIGDFFQDEQTQEKIENIKEGTKKIIDELEKVDINTDQVNTGQIKKPINAPIIKLENSDEPLQTNPTHKIEDVVVNIVCSQNQGNLINVSTGSGVLIDPKGVIVTNAHVGQFVLLEDQSDSKNGMKCGVYRENIPTFGYTVDILHISPDWIEQNFNLINSASPRGTGEFDYAFLYITGNTNPVFKRPTIFPYSEVSLNEDYEVGTKVDVAGYPGAPQNIVDIAKAGHLKKDNVSIEDVFTFNKNTIDIFSTTKTHVGARGASGGGVFKDGKLIGIISTTNGTQNDAEINAITTKYINRDLDNNTGIEIKDLIQNNLYKTVLDFSKNYGANLANLLFSEIN